MRCATTGQSVRLFVALCFGFFLQSEIMAQNPPPDEFNPGANLLIETFAVQGDGKILAGGAFSILAGQSRTCIGRLNWDGSIDESFNPGANQTVLCIAIQPDGMILVGGSFTSIAGQSRNKIARLYPDGSLDMTFNPDVTGNAVHCLALQPDGKILVGGSFSAVSGQTRYSMARLLPNGAPEGGFTPHATNGNNAVYSITPQPDGKLLVGGAFERLAGQSRTNIGRLNADGSCDTTFNARIDDVYAIVMQPDWKILIAGHFYSVNGQVRPGLARLNQNGSLDTGFDAGSSVTLDVLSIVLQTDGKIVAGGFFSTLNRKGLARVNSNGSTDTAFTTQAAGVNPFVIGLAAQADGRIIVGGLNFTNLGGQPRIRVGRLNVTSTATQNLNYTGSTVTWLRGGSSPEVWRTTFEASTNSLDWVMLGDGARIPGGWQLTNVTLPPAATIRARGYLSSGDNNGSCYFVESAWPTTPPVIYSQDGKVSYQTNSFGFNIGGSAGSLVAVDRSPDFTAWTPMVTNMMPSGPFPIKDTNAASASQQFYRARLVQ